MTYVEYITRYIEQQAAAAPIYTADIAKMVEGQFQLEPQKAAAATAVALKRIMDSQRVPALRCYQKGIYYKTLTTPFGELGIDKEQLIARKYLDPDQGYETGPGLLYRMGLTSQLPNGRVIATNAARECVRRDARLNVSICLPKTEITAENKAYLQCLDVLEQLELAPVDAQEPYHILSEYIRQHHLRYDILLALADRYYPQRAMIQLGHTAGKGAVEP